MQSETATKPVTQAAGQISTADITAWLPEAIQPYWEILITYPIIAAIIIITLGLIVSRVVVGILKRIVSNLTARTNTQIDDQLITILSRPVSLTVVYLSLILATTTLALPQSLTNFISNALLSLIVLLWMTAAISVSNVVLDTLGRFSDQHGMVQESTIPLFEMVSKILLIGIAGYLLLQVWQVDPTAWLASAGVVGIAVGFAARDTLANLFSGVFIVMDRPYKKGDFINLDGGERGMVTHVGLRSTRLLTRDDIEVTIPNAVMANSKIVNETSGRWPKRRLRIKAGVGYGSDVDHVVAVLLDIAAKHEGVAKDPEPRVRMRALGNSSLDFELLCWISEPVHSGKITHDLLMSVYKGFVAEGIEIPFPKSDVYIKEAPTKS